MVELGFDPRPSGSPVCVTSTYTVSSHQKTPCVSPSQIQNHGTTWDDPPDSSWEALCREGTACGLQGGLPLRGGVVSLEKALERSHEGQCGGFFSRGLV